MGRNSVAPTERICITCRLAGGDATEEVELPLAILVVGDFTRRPDPRAVADRTPISIDKDSFDRVLAEQKLSLELTVPDRLTNSAEDRVVKLAFGKLSDFEPESIAKQVPAIRALLEEGSAISWVSRQLLGGMVGFPKAIQRALGDESSRMRLALDIASSDASTPTGVAGSLFEEICVAGGLRYCENPYARARLGGCIRTFLITMLAPENAGVEVSRQLAEVIRSEIDQRLSVQINEILHHPEFQRLEAAWRSLKFLVDRVDFRENIEIEILDVSKQDLLEDFDDSPEVFTSGLYKLLDPRGNVPFAVKPVSLIVGNYEFAEGPQDIRLLQGLASVAARTHAPFISGTSPQMFGIDTWEKLAEIEDLTTLFTSPRYARWQAFRESEDARYVGLTMPRFLLRMPYGANKVPVTSFNFEEDSAGSHDKYLWGNAAVALATRVAGSFARYGWCPNIIGPQAGGMVEDLPLHRYEAMGEMQTKIPTEVQFTERREYELSEEGFIGLIFWKDGNNACFLSANSAQKAKYFGRSPEDREAEINYRLGTQLPYSLIMTRFFHYLRTLQREHGGSWRERVDMERELNTWIGQYVADLDDPGPGIRWRRPLRKASVEVKDVVGRPRRWRCELKVRPQFKYMGAAFTLSVVGWFDHEQPHPPADVASQFEEMLCEAPEAFIEVIDARLGAQLNAILRHPKFQRLEAAWRGLKYLVDRVDFRENIKIEVLNVSKEDLLADFDDSPDVTRSRLYKLLDRRERTTFVVRPVSLVVGNYEFADGPRNIRLLQGLASVAAMTSTPFISGTSPQMFGIDTWEKLPEIKDLKTLFARPRYARWHAFRESEDARYVGLTMPRFLLRTPYGASTLPERSFRECFGPFGPFMFHRECRAIYILSAPGVVGKPRALTGPRGLSTHESPNSCRSSIGMACVSADRVCATFDPRPFFPFEEDVQGRHDHLLWGNAAVALAERVAACFAMYRWCPNIIGPKGGGAVENLSFWQSSENGVLVTRNPIEAPLTASREDELSEEGFIPLSFSPLHGFARFISANSTKSARYFGESPEDREAETNYRLGTQLPYLLIMTRFFHYLRTLQREHLGSWRERVDLERELNIWIGQYVADMDDPAPGVRSRRPLRKASVEVRDVEGQPGWYRCDLKVRPHFKYMGAAFTLSLVARLHGEGDGVVSHPVQQPVLPAVPTITADEHFDRARRLGTMCYQAYRAVAADARFDNVARIETVRALYGRDAAFRDLWDAVKGGPPTAADGPWLALWKTP